MKFILLVLVKIYKYTEPLRNLIYTSIGISGGCRQNPSCSQYAQNILSDNRYDTIQSVWLIIKRLGQCHSFYKPKPTSH